MARPNGESLSTNMTTTSRAGRPLLSELPELSEYSSEELARAERVSPALRHYLQLLQRSAASAKDRLRLKRHEFWARCALATFLDRADAETVCRFWSDASERLIGEAWVLAGCENAGLGLLALGKLGAQELNLSS